MENKINLDMGISDGENLEEPFGLNSEGKREYETFHISFNQAKDILTDKRIEILRALTRKYFDSITELTEDLDRDKKNVSEDIKKLYENGIIDIEQKGRKKAPRFRFNKIVLDPLTFENNINRDKKDSPDNEIRNFSKALGEISDDLANNNYHIYSINNPSNIGKNGK